MLNDLNSQDSESVIADLQSQIDRLIMIVNRSQNINNVGIGQTLPAPTASGIQVPPVSAVTANKLNNAGGQNIAVCTWLNPESNTPIDRYNVYVQNAFESQTQETLVASVHTPPVIFTYASRPGNAMQVIVQTVLSNGQTIPIPNCPSTAVLTEGLPVYANNAAAIAGGLVVGSEYRTGADPDPVCVVH